MARFFDIAEVKRAAQGRWASVLADCGVNASLLRNVHGPCPGCGGNDRFRFDDKDGSGSFICSQGGGGNLAGDGVALLMHVTGKEWKDCVNLLGEAMGIEPRAGGGAPRPVENPGVAPEPRAEARKQFPLDMGRVRDALAGVPPVTEEWLRRRSPVAIEEVTSGDFLNAIFEPGERVPVFESQRSQGDFLWVAGKEPGDGSPSLRGGWRLSQEREVKAVKSALPRKAKEGVWYLVQPVTGQWAIKPDVQWKGSPKDAGGEGMQKEVRGSYTRRSAVNVTGWKHIVLESDELPAEDWLRIVVSLPLPIAALYTSGGRSIHALLRMPCGSKAEWDAMKKMLTPVVCPLGADLGALSAVRLSRLPGCYRGDRLQKLLWLNPMPEVRPMRLMQEVRN